MSYIADLTLAHDGSKTMGDMQAATQKVIDCALENGFTLLDGTLGLAREDRPMETFSLGSSSIWSNEAGKKWTTGASTA